MKNIIIILLIVCSNSICYSQSPKRIETVMLNGAETYYEVYGKGEPLFLLHGITQSSAIWKEYVSHFASDFEVYLVDIKGHGKSSPLRSEFTYQAAVDDLLALMDYLDFDSIKAIGFSYGGELLLQLCSDASHRIESMVINGAEYDFSAKGLNLKYEDVSEKDKETMRKAHIHGEAQIKAIYKLFNNLEIHLSNDQLSKIKTKTLLIYGENDGWFAEDLCKVVNLHQYLPDSHLWIVPNTGHRAFIDKNKPEFIRIAKEFLMGEWQ